MKSFMKSKMQSNIFNDKPIVIKIIELSRIDLRNNNNVADAIAENGTFLKIIDYIKNGEVVFLDFKHVDAVDREKYNLFIKGFLQGEDVITKNITENLVLLQTEYITLAVEDENNYKDEDNDYFSNIKYSENTNILQDDDIKNIEDFGKRDI